MTAGDLLRPAIACLVVSAALGIALMVPSIAVAKPAHTDIMLLFDTSGSMSDALSEASAEIDGAMEQISADLPDIEFGLSEVRDYGGSIYDEEDPEDVPWQLDVPMTADRGTIQGALENLYAEGGGDEEEAYGRALWEADTNPGVGWRSGARHLIVLVADDVPHDDDLDQGIPERLWVEEAPWYTGKELPEPGGVVGTLYRPGVSLDFQTVLQQLAVDGKPLEFVDYQGDSDLLPYWENWAARTGGKAVLADAGELVNQLVGIAEAGATGPCAPVHGSTGKMLLASLKCTAALTELEAKCAVELSIAKALKGLTLAKGLIDVRKVRKSLRPLARLVNDIRRAKFLRHAPPGFRTSTEVVEKFKHADTALEVVKILPNLVKAVSPVDFKRIALDIGDIIGAKACVQGLILAVE